VLVRENPAAPVVAYSLMVKMGTRTETPDIAGISNLLQQMLVRGTEKLDGEQIAEAADRMGGSIDAYGDADYSEIAATALDRYWSDMLGLMADIAAVASEGTLQAVRDFLPTGETAPTSQRTSRRTCFSRRPLATIPTRGIRSGSRKGWSAPTTQHCRRTIADTTCRRAWCWR
jgi:hypothetical protein